MTSPMERSTRNSINSPASARAGDDLRGLGQDDLRASRAIQEAKVERRSIGLRRTHRFLTN